MEQSHLNIHQDAQQTIHLNHPRHVEELCRHLFSDSPKGLALVEKAFSAKSMPVELPPRQVKNRLVHEPYSSG